MPTELTTRQREIVFNSYSGRDRVYNVLSGMKLMTDITYVRNVVGTQKTESEGHPFNSRKKTKQVYDIGGPFRTTRNRVEYTCGASNPPYAKFDFKDKFLRFVYDGPVFPVPAKRGYDNTVSYGAEWFPPTMESSTQKLFALGGTAIARCKPTNSIANLSIALLELKNDGLPSLFGSSIWKSQAKSLRKTSSAAGSEYLNLQFGWAPLISDVQKTFEAAQKADALIAQYKKDDGQLVRRGYKFPIEDTVEVTTIPYNVPPGHTGVYSLGRYHDSTYPKTHVLTRNRNIVRNIYFKGAFTYHLPTSTGLWGKIESKAMEARKLYGLTLDPSVVWNVMPWSWAADWAVNYGDLISNISAMQSDGLVMPYGYIMEHTIVTDTYTADLSAAGLGSQSVSFITETKKRLPASPFGFGLIWKDFSPYQLSIMSALGLNRGSRR